MSKIDFFRPSRWLDAPAKISSNKNINEIVSNHLKTVRWSAEDIHAHTVYDRNENEFDRCISKSFSSHQNVLAMVDISFYDRCVASNICSFKNMYFFCVTIDQSDLKIFTTAKKKWIGFILSVDGNQYEWDRADREKV